MKDFPKHLDDMVVWVVLTLFKKEIRERRRKGKKETEKKGRNLFQHCKYLILK